MRNVILDLVETPDNLVPEGAELRMVTAGDGTGLRAVLWPPQPGAPGPEGASRGVVTILQGRGEFIEKYFETVADLRRRGFHVVAFDWRGQGGSQRPFRRRTLQHVQRGHVRDFADYQRDLDAVLTQVVAPLPGPRFALCHSMGGAIALTRAAEPGHGHGLDRRDFDRIVAVAPLIALSPHVAPFYTGPVARLAATLGLARVVVPAGRRAVSVRRPFAGNRLTSDEVRFNRVRAIAEQAPWLALGEPTFGWLAAACRTTARLASPGFALRVATPALVIAAGSDRIVSTPAIERFSARLKAGNALVLPYARHEILIENDDIRATFWAAFDAFIPGRGLIGGEQDQPFSSASAVL